MIFLKKYFFSTQPSPSNHPKALLKEIKIEIKKNQGLISGLYKSTFKGKGLEFSSLRSYVRGDDIRAIDWNSFAKTGSMFVREYIEERDTTIILAIDSSQSQRFGHLNKSKYELISHVASLISHAALQNRDKLGLIHYSDQIESYDKPITGVSHNFKIISKIVNAKNSDKIAEVSVLVKFILNFQKKR